MQDLQKVKTLLVEERILAAFVNRAKAALIASYREAWQQGSVNRRIFAAMLTVGTLTAAVKVVSTFKEMVVARQFGVSDGLDALLIAYLLPSFAINVVAGSFNAALVPTYIQVREQEGHQAAQRLFSSVVVWSAALLIGVSILMGFAAPYLLPILGSGFTPEKLTLTRQLFFILLPTLPLSGLFATWVAVLNANERFALAAITPVATPIVAIALVYGMGDVWGIYAFAVAMIAGAIVEGILLASGLARRGISLVPRWHGFSPAMRQVMKQYAPMIAAGVLMNSTVIVDQAMAATLGAGSVSVLSYGNKAVAMMLGVGSLALSTAILPQFSHMVAAKDWSAVRHTLKTYARLVLMSAVPVTVGLMLVSRFIVMMLFERGAFTASNTLEVAAVQNLYLLQMPFYLVGMLFVRLISALGANYILLWGTAISAVMNVTLDYLLMKWLGVSGIALSTSIVYIAALAFLSLMALRALKKAEAQTSNLAGGPVVATEAS